MGFVVTLRLCLLWFSEMREFIGNPNREEFYEEDDVESDVFFDGADEVIYLDPNDMGIEIDDDYDDDEGDEDFESLSFGDHFSSEEDEEDEYVDDEESLSDEGLFFFCYL